MAESLSTEGFTKGMLCGSNGEGERESDQLIFFGGSEDPGSDVGVSELESEGQLEMRVLGLRIDLKGGGGAGVAGANVGGAGIEWVGRSMATVLGMEGQDEVKPNIC